MRQTGLCAAASAGAVSTFAIDLEFIKCRGNHFSRSIAFVPFTAALPGAPAASAAVEGGEGGGAEAPECSAAGGGVALNAALPQRTLLCAPATVLSLTPEAVMSSADVLPCGHVVLPLLEAQMLRGAALEELKTSFEEGAAGEYEAYRDLRKSLREARQAERLLLKRQQALEREDEGPTEGPAEGAAGEATQPGKESRFVRRGLGGAAASTDPPPAPPPPQAAPVAAAPTNALSPAEQRLQKELQIRLALTRHFDLLCPYGVPNVRRWRDPSPFTRLIDCDVESADFAGAVAQLMPLRAYGKGRGGKKPLGFLLRYHPAFAQELLRRSFHSSAALLRFLDECAAAVEADLNATQALHQSGRCPLAAARAWAQPPAATVVYSEYRRLEDFAMAMNRTWGALQHRSDPHKAAKFFTYGNADARVVHATLGLTLPSVLPRSSSSNNNNFSSRAMAAGRSSRPANAPPPVAAVPSDALLSPFQARVTDATQHPLFTAAGFVPQVRRVPPLGEALRKAANGDRAADGVLRLQRPHDPLWDAQALACVCVAAGLVRPDRAGGSFRRQPVSG